MAVQSRTFDTSSPDDASSVADDERYIVVSCDGHAGTPMSVYREHVEARFLDDFDAYARMVTAYDAETKRLQLEQSVRPAAGSGAKDKDRHVTAFTNDEMIGLHDPTQRMRDIEADMVVGEVIFPQGSIPFHSYPPFAGTRRQGTPDFNATREMLNGGIRAYNRWLSEFCNTYPGRLAGIAVIPIDDIELAVRETEWAREAGLIGGISLPPITDTRLYHEPQYDLLWSACESLSMPVNVHGSSNAPFYGHRPEASAILISETDWWTRRPLSFFVFGGVFERHPNLRFVLTEQRAHWFVPTMEEFDSLYETPHTRSKALLPRKPSEYMLANVYVGASFLSHAEIEGAGDVALDRFMWGSDYPHSEGTWPWSLDCMRKTLTGLSTGERKAILSGNALKCYDLLDENALRAAADRCGPTVAELEQPWTRPTDFEALSWGLRDKVWS